MALDTMLVEGTDALLGARGTYYIDGKSPHHGMIHGSTYTGDYYSIPYLYNTSMSNKYQQM
jgi:hypothetical protein